MGIKIKPSIPMPQSFRAENLKMPTFVKDFIFMILLFFVFVPSSFNHDLNVISLNFVIPVLFVYAIYKSPYLLGKFRFFRLLLILLCWMLLSGIAAVDADLYWNEIRKFVGGLMITFVIIRFSRVNYRYIYYFYILYILKFIYIFYYAYQNGLFTTDVSSERFNLDDLNANVFGYFGFFAMVASFLLATYTQKLQQVFYSILFVIIFILAFTAGVLAASRATLLITLIAFCILIMIRYLYPITRRSIFPIIVIVVSFIIINNYLEITFQNSLVKERFDATGDSRFDLLKRAIDVGERNFVFGVGSGNFALYNPERKFSHNSFAELWANNGIIALVIFLFILFDVLRNITQYRKLGGNKKNSLYFVVIWATYFIYNFFYVFYINFFMLSFIFLIYMHLEQLKTVRLNLSKQKHIANSNVSYNGAG